MNVDAMIDSRWRARQSKNYAESDRLRDILDSHLVFTFDHKDYQEVHYLPEKYFKSMERAGFSNKRKYVEYRLAQDRKAEAYFEAWLFSVNQSRRQ